jgi:predicted small integral membrane protein
MTDLTWMAWTWQTGLFFAGIASLLLIMTVLAIYARRPSGWVLYAFRPPGATGSSSRFSARLSIHLAWLGLVGPDLWWASGLSLLFAAAVFRAV